ncbi:MAG: hypothetical protein EBZ48_06960 [Proteobacteria bacterium]|nr:hypothetical protein [Pseudomonadota bacterium]
MGTGRLGAAAFAACSAAGLCVGTESDDCSIVLTIVRNLHPVRLAREIRTALGFFPEVASESKEFKSSPKRHPSCCSAMAAGSSGVGLEQEEAKCTDESSVKLRALVPKHRFKVVKKKQYPIKNLKRFRFEAISAHNRLQGDCKTLPRYPSLTKRMIPSVGSS